jgi:hypothetical protein
MTRALLGIGMFTWACSPTKAQVGAAATSGVSSEPITVGDDTTDDSNPMNEDDPDDGPVQPDDEEEEEESRPEGTAMWTVMVYLNGDNNLEVNALIDMNEMEQAGSTEDVHVLVQLDRSPHYAYQEGNWSGARRYRVEQDTDMNAITSPVLEDLGDVDSGAVDTFIDFATWGVENFPAQRYAYIIWDHGWGWTAAPRAERKGVSEDEQTGSDISVANGELDEILSADSDVMGGKMALMGMDACLMASWEVATVAEPYAKYFVGSQATESVDGWAYHTTMDDLLADPEMNAAEFGTVIAQRFYETDDSTQSVVDLTDFAYLNTAIDTLAQTVLDQANPRDAIIDFTYAAQSFDGDMPDLDLGDLSQLLSEESESDEIATAADTILDEVEASIVANYTNGRRFKNATGLSIYLPTRGRVSDRYTTASWASLTEWDEMIAEIQD